MVYLVLVWLKSGQYLAGLIYLGDVERVMGIEPTWLAWKARTLPLSYTRIVRLGCNIIVGRCCPYQGTYLSRTSLTLFDKVVGRNGFCMNSRFCSLMVS